jgi:hypothetical protein
MSEMHASEEVTPEQRLLVNIFGDIEARENVETYSVTDIRRAFAAYASDDGWGIPSFYEGGLISALRGEFDDLDPRDGDPS